MTSRLRKAFINNLKSADWMDYDTKQSAKEKVKKKSNNMYSVCFLQTFSLSPINKLWSVLYYLGIKLKGISQVSAPLHFSLHNMCSQLSVNGHLCKTDNNCSLLVPARCFQSFYCILTLYNPFSVYANKACIFRHSRRLQSKRI